MFAIPILAAALLAMTDAFFLLILPTRTLTIHFGSHRQCMGLSLRGSCTSPTEAAHLVQTVQRLLAHRPAQAWIDSRHLHHVGPLGEQALLQATSCGRQVGTVLYWCGLPPGVCRALQASGTAAQLQLRPAAGYAGPSFLLPTERRPAMLA